MKACFLTGPRKTVVRDVAIPEIKDDEILMRVTMVGMCASELHPWMEGSRLDDPVMGHEPVGYVEKVGDRVQHLKVGDRVTAIGARCFAEYAALPAQKVIRVPDSIPDDQALGEPLSCLISAAENTPVHLGDTCAVVGLGYMGTIMTNLIALKGAGRLVAIDGRVECRASALKHGATEFMTPDQVPECMKLTRWEDKDLGYGIDLACEVSGNANALNLAGELVRQHGVLSIEGYHQGGPRSINMELWNWKALTVINGHERRTDYQMQCMRRGLELISVGRLDLSGMVTHRFAPDHLDDAFNAIIQKPEGYIKGVICF